MKNKKRRALSVVLCLVLALSMLPVAALAADYDDTDGHWAENAIDRWTDSGVVNGADDGEFHPDRSMTRAEAAQVFTNLLKLTEKADLTPYTDAGEGAWYDDALSKVVKAEIMRGVSSTALLPDGILSREQMFVMVARALGIQPEETADKSFDDADKANDWAAGYINALVNMGVISGVDDTHILPLSNIDRGSAMTVLDNLIGGYANEEGDTVEIVPGKITLIVADDVTVTGTADLDLPIVVTGEAGKVDMADVKGEAVVSVQVSDVAIENAPVGTTVAAADDVTDVTVGDIDVTEDPDKEVVVEEEETTPTPPPSGGGSTVTDSFDEDDIDAIITAGITSVNAKMAKPEGTYAKLEDLQDDNTVTVRIYNGETSVGAVYQDIITPLITALVENKANVATVKAVKDTTGQVPSDDAATLDLSTLEMSDTMKIVAFVKQLVPSVQGGGTIGATVGGKNFEVKVTDKGTGSNKTEVTYTVKFVLVSLDKKITEQVSALNTKMSAYAEVSYAEGNHTLTVNITNEGTLVSAVYGDIQEILKNAMNEVRDSLSKVEGDKQDGDDKVTLPVNREIEGTDIATFVQALKFTKDGNSMKVEPSTTIETLKGYTAKVSVTFVSSTTPVEFIINFSA